MQFDINEHKRLNITEFYDYFLFIAGLTGGAVKA